MGTRDSVRWSIERGVVVRRGSGEWVGDRRSSGDNLFFIVKDHL